MISVEKPGSPEEVLEHFGTKGMKWGVRRTKGTKEFNTSFPTRRSRDREILRARKSVRKSEDNLERARTPKERKKLVKANLKNPDRATALRMTHGEKVVNAILIGGLLPVAFVPTIATGATLHRIGKRRAIEKSQGKG